METMLHTQIYTLTPNDFHILYWGMGQNLLPSLVKKNTPFASYDLGYGIGVLLTHHFRFYG